MAIICVFRLFLRIQNAQKNLGERQRTTGVRYQSRLDFLHVISNSIEAGGLAFIALGVGFIALGVAKNWPTNQNSAQKVSLANQSTSSPLSVRRGKEGWGRCWYKCSIREPSCTSEAILNLRNGLEGNRGSGLF